MIFLGVSVLVLSAAVVYHALVQPPSPRTRLIMAIADDATAIESAATALTSAASELTTSAAAIATAIQNAGNTDALTQPLADLGTAVTAVQTAADAVKQAAGA